MAHELRKIPVVDDRDRSIPLGVALVSDEGTITFIVTMPEIMSLDKRLHNIDDIMMFMLGFQFRIPDKKPPVPQDPEELEDHLQRGIN